LGKEELAEALYERVLRLDPSSAAAGANLAIYRARKGRSSEAIALWQDVFERNPSLASAGINLAVAQLAREIEQVASGLCGGCYGFIRIWIWLDSSCPGSDK
jgi:tetratricopeptide (TPR) repeat protein